jgi:hypothetical protein
LPSITQPAAPCHVPAGTDEEIVLGVDTHKDVHAAAVITTLGATLDGRSFPTTIEGYRQLVAWARSFGVLRRAGVECTGSYGAALTRHLRAEAVGRSILVIVWHLLSDTDARFQDLGSDFNTRRIDPERRKRSHVHQLEALGYKVSLEPAAA